VSKRDLFQKHKKNKITFSNGAVDVSESVTKNYINEKIIHLLWVNLHKKTVHVDQSDTYFFLPCSGTFYLII